MLIAKTRIEHPPKLNAVLNTTRSNVPAVKISTPNSSNWLMHFLISKTIEGLPKEPLSKERWIMVIVVTCKLRCIPDFVYHLVRSTMAKEEHYQYQIRVLLKENRRMKRQLKKRRETSSGESVSSSEHDELFMTSPAFLGWEQPPPMSSSSASSAAAAAAATAAMSRPMTATTSSYNMYMAPASSSFTNHSPPVGATLSYYDDDDDSDSASYTHMPGKSADYAFACTTFTDGG